MFKWDSAGIPHKGWKYLWCEDVRDYGEDYETCEMCGNDQVRYIHVLTHPDYGGRIRVGCKCAEKMMNDYKMPCAREKYMANRAKRLENFRKREWRRNQNGNWVLRYKGKWITVITRNEAFRFVYNGEWTQEYKGKRIYDWNVLKLAVFDVIDGK